MPDEIVPFEPLNENKIVAAILAVGWFMQHGLEAGARNRERLVSEYQQMLDLVLRAGNGDPAP